MKSSRKVLVYDDYCPLCSWYSGLFVRLGLLDAGNRVAFSQADPALLTAIDLERAVDEIPLFDAATGRTLYGIDALLDLLGQRAPLVKSIGNIRPVKWGLKKLYKLISYNRKVIIARKCGAGGFDCSPAFNGFYRILFLFLFLVINSLMLFPLHEQLFCRLSFYRLTSWQLQAAHIVFVSVNCSLALFFDRKPALEYLGQINMLALTSILLLSALMALQLIIGLPEWLIAFCLGLQTAFVITEYFRRMHYAGIMNHHKMLVAANLICLFVFLLYVFH